MKVYGYCPDVYEGDEPYLFVSYSHKDNRLMTAVKQVLEAHKIRYWYDNGLHSGDDWNMVIAKHLKGASACLLLLSPNSSASEYVKNELNFAMNHRVPIHTLLIKQFVLPLDIEMMTGRIQMIEMQEGYEQKLVKDLPPEVFSDEAETYAQEKNSISHPLFDVEEQLSDRQRTRIYAAKHKRLNYQCAVLEDLLQSDEIAEIESRLVLSSKVDHVLYPKLIDYQIDGNRLFVYQDYIGAVFLDDYLSSNSLKEDTILSWIFEVTDGISAMHRMNLAFRDFARGSMIVTDKEELKIIRNYHPYYGYVKIQEETKRYYLEKELQEIAILLAQLCMGKEPVLPIRIIEDSRFSKNFLLKINLIIQKCVKENGRAQYCNFEELLKDIKACSFPVKEKAFLRKRAKKLAEYDRVRDQRNNNFVSTDRAAPKPYKNLEEQFGFDETVLLQEPSVESKSVISILMCSTGQVLNFDKKRIVVGRGPTDCDMIWTQPYISRRHLIITHNGDETFTVQDLSSMNGTYVLNKGKDEMDWVRIPQGSETVLERGAKIKVGSSEIQLL